MYARSSKNIKFLSTYLFLFGDSVTTLIFSLNSILLCTFRRYPHYVFPSFINLFPNLPSLWFLTHSLVSNIRISLHLSTHSTCPNHINFYCFLSFFFSFETSCTFLLTLHLNYFNFSHISWINNYVCQFIFYWLDGNFDRNITQIYYLPANEF